MTKSPLRYPGGKSRAIQQMKYLLPQNFSEYREPFVGGGSFFLYLRQVFPQLSIWINDLNPELYYFWKYVQLDSEKLAQEITQLKVKSSDGQALFNELVAADKSTLSELERAVRFFVLNRITFSGVVESGGYSQLAFLGRFTESSIRRTAELGKWMEGIKITNLDYRAVLVDGGKETFTFLDPPYIKATKSKLYGKKGILHTEFNHQQFAEQMKTCQHAWLITYDDSPLIRANFDFAHIYSWELQYGMNNYKQGKAEKGSELFISNYPLTRMIHTRTQPNPVEQPFLFNP
ncbi:MAG TPA: DNA adenine methylase [Anaerolineales bacterium]|nr:DNA adenine methylase [Anaerolineales bacterium]